MTEPDVGEVLCEREYEIVGKDGRVVVRIGKPRSLEEIGECAGPSAVFCPVQIVGPGFGRVYAIRGIDAFQAIQYGLQVIGDILVEVQNVSKFELRWKHGRPGEHGFERTALPSPKQ